MRKELILIPSHQGDSQIFIIPKKQMILNYEDKKQYRVFIEEI